MSEESKPLPSVEEFIFEKTWPFETDPCETEVKKHIEGSRFEFFEVEKLLKEYGELCIRKALEVAAEEAEVNVIDYNDYEVSKNSILKLVDDERLKVR